MGKKKIQALIISTISLTILAGANIIDVEAVIKEPIKMKRNIDIHDTTLKEDYFTITKNTSNLIMKDYEKKNKDKEIEENNKKMTIPYIENEKLYLNDNKNLLKDYENVVEENIVEEKTIEEKTVEEIKNSNENNEKTNIEEASKIEEKNVEQNVEQVKIEEEKTNLVKEVIIESEPKVPEKQTETISTGSGITSKSYNIIDSKGKSVTATVDVEATQKMFDDYNTYRIGVGLKPSIFDQDLFDYLVEGCLRTLETGITHPYMQDVYSTIHGEIWYSDDGYTAVDAWKKSPSHLEIMSFSNNEYAAGVTMTTSSGEKCSKICVNQTKIERLSLSLGR